MTKKTFTLMARISTENPKAVKPILEELVPKESITPTDEGFLVQATMQGEYPRELNKTLLSALRRVRTQNPSARGMDVRQHNGTFLRLCAKGITKRLRVIQHKEIHAPSNYGGYDRIFYRKQLGNK